MHKSKKPEILRYANKYHKGSDGKTKSTIDNCGDPRIEVN